MVEPILWRCSACGEEFTSEISVRDHEGMCEEEYVTLEEILDSVFKKEDKNG